MARLLLVDDDPAQLAIRRLLLERDGHTVTTAADAAAAREQVAEERPDLVLMDLRLPRMEDGLKLISFCREQHPSGKIVVLSGAAAELNGRPEAALVDRVVAKPARSAALLSLITKLACLLLLLGSASGVRAAARFEVRADSAGEYVADIRMSAPGTAWSQSGHEAALARVKVGEDRVFHVMLWGGARMQSYPVFLGTLPAGVYPVEIETEVQWSAPGARVEVASFEARPGAPGDPVLAHAPVLFARENTIGLFSDVPLFVYAERDGDTLTYTVVFSNEDGGTSTRALMARWGRTTDIEYVYKVDLRTGAAVIQAKDHKEIPFNGVYEGRHPLLIPSTNNNMVTGEGRSPIRYQINPVPIDLRGGSREQVMDARPELYRAMAEELEREGKIRPFGTVRGQHTGDPRSYLYVDLQIANRDSALAAHVRLRGESIWRSSNLGRVDYALERDGPVRTTVELPPGTTPGRVAEIGFSCVLPHDPKLEPKRGFFQSGECTVEAVRNVFFLSREYVPQAGFWSRNGAVKIPAGQLVVFSLPEPATRPR